MKFTKNAVKLTLIALLSPSSTIASDPLQECISSQETEDFVEVLFALSAKQQEDGTGYQAPASFTGFLPVVNVPINADIPLLWFANRIPSEFGNPDNIPGVPSWPAEVDSEVGPFDPDYSDVGHKKFGALPFPLLAIANLSPDILPSEEFNTIFFKNLEDRGAFNERKKQYMTALTCDKLEHYEAKIEKALDKLLSAVGDGVPILGKWDEILFDDLFLDLHLGEVEGGHPSYVKEYIGLQRSLLSDLKGIDSRERDDDLKKVRCLTSSALEYYGERAADIREKEDKSTFLYWWSQAGVPPEAVLFEAAHNALAFSTLVNTLYLLAVDKIGSSLGAPGYVQIKQITPTGGNVEPQPAIDFFAKYKEANSNVERLNVVREAFRLLLPSNAWQSTAQKAPGANDGLSMSNESFNPEVSLHLPHVIQALNDGFNPATGETNAYAYDTSRYEGFDQKSCPSSKGKFIQSEIDNETVVPTSHQKFIPIFQNPKYCPFGLGYRRCPAEIFNYFLTGKLMEKVGTFLDMHSLTTINIAQAIATGTSIQATVEAEMAILLDIRGILSGDPNFDAAVPKGVTRALDSIIALPKEKRRKKTKKKATKGGKR